MKTRPFTQHRLELHRFEDKVLPAATWPFVGGPATNPVIGTYGQYQDIKSTPWDLSIHMHEGLDIAVKEADEKVFAVADGFVSEIVIRKNDDYGSSVVVQDTKVFTPGTTKMWAYLHVKPDPNLTVDKPVLAGQTIIGRAARLPPALRGGGYVDHVHLNRGFGHDPAGPKESTLRKWPVPRMNPLVEFDSTLDRAVPVVEDIRFRPQAHDKPGTSAPDDGAPRLSSLQKEQVPTRTYFASTVTVGAETATVAGNLAPEASSEIDFVARMYDLHGPANTPVPAANKPGRLNPATVRFWATGRAWGGGQTGTIAGFNFKAVTDLKSVRYFQDFFRTRGVYSNDTASDSGVIGPFYYTVTNTESRTATFGEGGKFPKNASDYYWTTLARKGEPWNVGRSGKFAKSNAEAEFPDGLYDVFVEAADLSGNTGRKTALLLLDNWKQKIDIRGQLPPKPGGDIVVTRGEQFLAGQALTFYLVTAQAGQTDVPNGTVLSNSIGVVTADPNGEFKNAKFPGKAPAAGDWWVVPDYHGDGKFTPGLDPSFKITVPNPNPPNPMIFAARDEVSWTRGWTLEVGAPGVMANDLVPDWGSAQVELVAVGPGVSVNLRPDGSFTYNRLAGGTDAGWFEYRLSSGGQTAQTGVFILPTNDLPLPREDLSSVVHGRTLTVSVGDGLLRNDFDWDGDPLVVTSTFNPTPNGTLSVQPNGSFSYTPNSGFVGLDTYQYVVSDGTTQSGTVTLTIDVTNAAPVGLGDAYVARAGQPLIVAAGSGVRINDTDDNADPMTVNMSLPPEHGTLSLAADGSFTYTPTPGYIGYDSFVYAPTDGVTAGTEVFVSILVTNGALVGDNAWDDQDRDGVRDYGEPALPGITVRLLDGTATQVAQTVTDEYGHITFDAVPGTYRLKVDLPAGASPSPMNIGSDDDADSDFDATGLTAAITLADGSARYDVDAGLFAQAPTSPTLGGRAWRDLDGNGVRDPGEPGWAGLTVRLLDASGTVLLTTTTRFDGTYDFGVVSPGQYRIQFVLPTGYSFVAADQGPDDRDSDVTDPLAGTTNLFTYGGGVNLDIDAGLVPIQ